MPILKKTIWLRTDIEFGLIRVHHILLLEIRQESRLQINSVVIVECCWTLLNGVETLLIICSQRAASGCIKRFFEGIDFKPFSLIDKIWSGYHQAALDKIVLFSGGGGAGVSTAFRKESAAASTLIKAKVFKQFSFGLTFSQGYSLEC